MGRRTLLKVFADKKACCSVYFSFKPLDDPQSSHQWVTMSLTARMMYTRRNPGSIVHQYRIHQTTFLYQPEKRNLVLRNNLGHRLPQSSRYSS